MKLVPFDQNPRIEANFPENQLGASLKPAAQMNDHAIMGNFPENQLGASLKHARRVP